MLTGEVLDSGCIQVRSRLTNSLLRKLEGSNSFTSLSAASRLRNTIKGLLMIGSNLSQTKEFRDLFEDIITKVKLSLFCFLECDLIEMCFAIADCRTTGGVWSDWQRNESNS